ncbi:tRNA (adenosine(37)-N6)-threonylcarbamoyltransferase complex transferase subunit TsaD [Acetobacterium wieringae]|uniref:tRNA N6-adenosine threonylcarbamoyltransferase n=1 Tax=Acetobacterium wieringae TaxID=52694 RepID=A0ABY6HI75_9FIRM|nr:tRNA (adenosine(37)-N6)-threonylcarbamoyltransferase complex transferase subunit TsaD [Acetobacterium wieringae]UYO64236.1 tRNA (adenosine(37)-N6)-threonylcarbamoyltransferase complex transferase subunit TsaD [Acetobacterium wieringae]VUZ24229.1 tRNA N6-adenosine threonylcarbamoyltransferase [Acetobacterium wieringae]
MKILSIETSCDETSVAIVEDGRNILTNRIYSQIGIHQKYGGVVPEIASRNHVTKLPYIIDEALAESKLSLAEVDAIAVTNGPGLVGALLIGLSTAKAMAYSLGKPLIGVHHIEGHIAANFLQFPELAPPFLTLVVSGGHSHLVLVEDYQTFKVLGRTIDDAAGEAFDKISRVLGLGYPGGPAIDAAAKNGNPEAIAFPRVMLDKTEYNFSFSGLKSAVLNYLNGKKMKNEAVNPDDVAASFQLAVIEVLVSKTIACANSIGMKSICMAGGVSCNSLLRKMMGQAAADAGMTLYYPDPILCTDNAAMIGSMAYYNYINGEESDLSLNGIPGLKIGTRQ